MKIAIRVDASSQIGTGHFMRCLTLAGTLKQCEADIRFISRSLPEHLHNMLVEKNIELIPLENDLTPTPIDDLPHSHWLGMSQHQDAQATIHAISDRTWDWLIIDHYGLDARWESVMRQSARGIMVIDDLADRQHDCDILLDQNYYSDMETRYIGKVPKSCQMLLGPKYALLRDKFRKLRNQVKPQTGPIKRVLIFFGGVDADNFTGHAIEALSELGLVGLSVDVVIGTQHPCREQIKAACVQHGYICHVQTNKMAELMAAADLAIGAGGSATWECCCVGLPILVFCTANNQRKQIEDAAQAGLVYSPEVKADLTSLIQRHIYALIENVNLRKLISGNGMKAVDGRGTLRVISSFGMSDIEIRIAIPDDSENIFKWRNHPSIREVSRNASVIDWENHQSWFASILANPQKVLLVGQRIETPVGVVRFDKLNDDEAEISIYVVPDKSSSGLGRGLLQRSEQWLAINYPEIQKLRAHVLGENESSQKLFSEAGYQIESIYYSKRRH